MAIRTIKFDYGKGNTFFFTFTTQLRRHTLSTFFICLPIFIIDFEIELEKPVKQILERYFIYEWSQLVPKNTISMSILTCPWVVSKKLAHWSNITQIHFMEHKVNSGALSPNAYRKRNGAKLAKGGKIRPYHIVNRLMTPARDNHTNDPKTSKVNAVRRSAFFVLYRTHERKRGRTRRNKETGSTCATYHYKSFESNLALIRDRWWTLV